MTSLLRGHALVQPDIPILHPSQQVGLNKSPSQCPELASSESQTRCATLIYSLSLSESLLCH